MHRDKAVAGVTALNYFFIVNPASGRGKGKAFGRRLEEMLSPLKLDYQLVYTDKPMHAQDLAAKAAKDFAVIVTVGGDGTFQEILNGVVGSQAAVGILPVGSGNDFVRAVSIPVDMEKSLALLLRNKRRMIDLAKVNNRIYHNGVGVGFDAWAVHTGNQVTRLRGNAIYLYAVLHTLINFKPQEVELSFNGATYQKNYFLITVANGVSLGGGFYLTPDAQIDDGLLDLCLIQNMPKRSIIKNLIKVYSGKHKEDPRVEMVRTKQISIRSEKGFAVHADGELLSLNMKELDIKILPKSIELIC